MKMEKTECSETSAYKIQTLGNYPKESIQHTEHGESLKLRIMKYTVDIKQQQPVLIYAYLFFNVLSLSSGKIYTFNRLRARL